MRLAFSLPGVLSILCVFYRPRCRQACQSNLAAPSPPRRTSLPPPPQALSELKLGWCKLGLDGGRHAADLLMFNATLSALDLRGNALGNDGAIVLARGLKQARRCVCILVCVHEACVHACKRA